MYAHENVKQAAVFTSVLVAGVVLLFVYLGWIHNANPYNDFRKDQFIVQGPEMPRLINHLERKELNAKINALADDTGLVLTVIVFRSQSEQEWIAEEINMDELLDHEVRISYHSVSGTYHLKLGSQAQQRLSRSSLNFPELVKDEVIPLFEVSDLFGGIELMIDQLSSLSRNGENSPAHDPQNQ